MSEVKLKMAQKKKSSSQLSVKDNEFEANRAQSKKNALIFKSDKTRNLLENVCSQLDALNYDNFDILFPALINSMKAAVVLREELINEVGTDVLIKNRPELFYTAKQIEKKYDSTVKKFSEEEKRLERELNSLYQQKKLTVYQR
jgi:hypothetical protein